MSLSAEERIKGISWSNFFQWMQFDSSLFNIHTVLRFRRLRVLLFSCYKTCQT